jgi:hypothetical protein
MLWRSINLLPASSPRLHPHYSRDLKKMDALFTEHWREIYRLAGLVEERHIASVPGKEFPEPVRNRFQPSSLHYDFDWKEKLGSSSSSKQ